MTPPAVRAARSAARAYLANACAGTWLSLRDDLPGEPLGLRTPFGVRGDLARGLGAALVAPAPLLAGVAWLLARRRPLEDDAAALATLTGLGAAFAAGMVAEPVTREVLATPAARPLRTAVVAANLVLPVVMVVAGLRHLARVR